MKPRIAIIGIGNWGKNLLREFNTAAEIAYCVHKENPETSKWLAENYPQILTTTFDKVLNDQTIKAVVIATPINTHFDLAYKALESGKHVFLEKPGCESNERLLKIINLAKQKNLTLQIGYIFLNHPAFKYLKENIKEKIISLTFNWEKFGSFRENIISNLACHDLSILYALKNTQPFKEKLLYKKPAISDGDIAALEVEYSDETKASININRVSKNKTKTLTIITEKTIWFWDDTKIFKSTDKKPYELVFESNDSPLSKECEMFISAINKPQIICGDEAISVHKSIESINLL